MAISSSLFLSELPFQRSEGRCYEHDISSIFRKYELVSTKHWAANSSDMVLNANIVKILYLLNFISPVSSMPWTNSKVLFSAK